MSKSSMNQAHRYAQYLATVEQNIAEARMEDEELYEKILEHDLVEALRRCREMQTEPAIEPASFYLEADKWLHS